MLIAHAVMTANRPGESTSQCSRSRRTEHRYGSGCQASPNSVHRRCPGFEVGGIIHKALFERPLLRDASRRLNALAGQ